MTAPTLKIGTRGSPLALAQAHMVQAALVAAHGAAALGGTPEIVIVRTTGDAIQDRPLREIGGKGLFTREIEDALLAGRFDVAVHSSKDMPTLSRDGLMLAGAMAREDVRDVLISHKGGLDDLPNGARVGTTSLRRRAQLLRRRPDLKIEDLRGNVGTRLAKLERGELDAIVLAKAGLTRLGLSPAGMTFLDPDIMLPAAGQGTIGLEVRANDAVTAARVAAISHGPSFLALKAERKVLSLLNGSCNSPIGAHAAFSDGRVLIQALVLRADGSEAYGAAREGAASDAETLAVAIGEEIRAAAPPAFVAELLSGE